MPTKIKPPRQTEKQRTYRHLKRLWGECEVIDATANLRVMILPQDVKRARRKDPENCVFAEACKRTFQAKKLLFYRSCAYVELPDEFGKKRVERFVMDTSMRSLVAAFDRGETIIPEAGFLLKAPPSSRRLDRHIDYNDRSRARRLENGELMYPKRPEVRKIVALDLQVRNGTGEPHFVVLKPDK